MSRAVCIVAVLYCLAWGTITGTVSGQTNPAPLINEPLVPTSEAPGGLEFTLTVNGTGFVPKSVVNWNGGQLTTTFVNDAKLTATVSSAAIAVAHTARITVSSPSPGGGVSNQISFQVISPSTSISLTTSNFPTDVSPVAVVTGDFTATQSWIWRFSTASAPSKPDAHPRGLFPYF